MIFSGLDEARLAARWSRAMDCPHPNVRTHTDYALVAGPPPETPAAEINLLPGPSTLFARPSLMHADLIGPLWAHAAAAANAGMQLATGLGDSAKDQNTIRLASIVLGIDS
jgi:hypothetical protein